ncbi:hypothetical protein Mgra_00009058 [Meloidogyne graminicola]|uniref:EGF-like domain-containing protein n=1 Tax=Meloidogyne graminicola TaxID=189291 RepID=A0A8S9ZDZ0_9BILA|nr:hypothetical protein Mgra_00009058 [Meloidogyne graminicola]
MIAAMEAMNVIVTKLQDKPCDDWMFKCLNTGKCIPKGFTCDGDDDCGDRSDEVLFKKGFLLKINFKFSLNTYVRIDLETVPLRHEFRCSNHKCIPKRFFGNAIARMTVVMAVMNQNLNVIKLNAHVVGLGVLILTVVCPIGHFVMGRMIAETVLMNYLRVVQHVRNKANFDVLLLVNASPSAGYCSDNSDEIDEQCGGTSRPCSESEFRCNEGRCIPHAKVCDGTMQCNDGLDESQCTLRKCADGFRKCEDGTCILEHKWCDRSQIEGVVLLMNLVFQFYILFCLINRLECSNSVCISQKFICDGDNDCGDNSDETNDQCKVALCDPPLRFRCSHSKLCLNILQLCNGFNDCGEHDHSDEHLSMCSSFSEYGDCSTDEFKCTNGKCINASLACDRKDDCGDATDEIGCIKQNGKSCSLNSENGGCQHLCNDVQDGYYCHCRDGFTTDPGNPFDCIDIDECKGNNTCTQMCLNTKGSYLCKCVDDYSSGVVIGAMNGKDCRANGEHPLIMVASDDMILQFTLVGSRGRVNAASRRSPSHQQRSINAIEFDPRREFMFWLDTYQKKIFRSSLPKGNQSHEGQELLVNFGDNISPISFAVDYLTGNLYITATASDNKMSEKSALAAAAGRRRKRFSEGIVPEFSSDGNGVIYVTTSDGRYRRTIISGRLQIPTAIVTLPKLGRICFSDSGFEAKIQCADMDGNKRKTIISDLIYSPTTMAIDEGRDNRIYWSDPKYHKVDSCLPDGSRRLTIVRDIRTPWAIDVFENHLFWTSGNPINSGSAVSKESQNLYIQDKFGRSRLTIVASAIDDVHALRIQQRFARDMLRADSSCAKAQCSHLCVELPSDGFRCLCPDGSTQFDDGTCGSARIEELPIPKQCSCQNGGHCLLDGTCDCGDFEGEFCQKPSSVSKQLIGRFGNGAYYALLLMFTMLLCLAVMTALSIFIYKRKSAINKKRLASGEGSSIGGASVVTFHGNVISFSNPVLDVDRQIHQHQHDNTLVEELHSSPIKLPQSREMSDVITTTFTNPVYDSDVLDSFDDDSRRSKLENVDTGKINPVFEEQHKPKN